MEQSQMENDELNFEKNLWNRYEPLHDRLQRKISYLSKILGQFTEIHKVKKDYYKVIRPLTKDITLSEEGKNYNNIVKFVNDTNNKYIEYEDEMYKEIISNLKDLVDKMKKEKTHYDDFIKSLWFYNEERKKMENLKKIYHNSAGIAERSTLDLKNFSIKLKLDDSTLINEQIRISEVEAQNRLATASKDCKNYMASLDKANQTRIKLNKKQKSLLAIYEELEREEGMIYTKIISIINRQQKKVADLANGQLSIDEGLMKNININRDIKFLVQLLKSSDKPEETIEYVHYPTEIDFDKCNDTKDFKVYYETVKTMKGSIDNIFNSFNDALENKKNKMRELIQKFFDMNKTTDSNDRSQLLEYVQDQRTHGLFLITLSKLRTNNRFCRERFLIELLAEILNIILESAEKNAAYDMAKNCIILSQTFFYVDETNNNKKVYIVDYIKKNNWLKNESFWKNFITMMLDSELKKLQNIYSDSNVNIDLLNNKNVPNNIKKKVSEVLFSQLLPYINNMNEFNINKKIILKTVDEIIIKYNYLEQESIDTVYSLISSDKTELAKIRKEINESQKKVQKK